MVEETEVYSEHAENRLNAARNFIDRPHRAFYLINHGDGLT